MGGILDDKYYMLTSVIRLVVKVACHKRKWHAYTTYKRTHLPVPYVSLGQTSRLKRRQFCAAVHLQGIAGLSFDLGAFFPMQVDPQPSGPSSNVNMKVVARIGWVAAVLGLQSLAEACAKRAAASQVQ
jgi:hypothetical protein